MTKAKYRYSYELNEEEKDKVEFLAEKGISQISWIKEGLYQAYDREKEREA